MAGGALGEGFWLAEEVPGGYESLGYRTYKEVAEVAAAEGLRTQLAAAADSPAAGDDLERLEYELPRSNVAGEHRWAAFEQHRPGDSPAYTSPADRLNPTLI